MVDGFFSMAFTGTAGTGFGVIALHNGALAGTDVAGASYDGSYSQDPETSVLDFNITMSALAGLTPVQTGIALAAPMTMPIRMSLAARDFTGNRPAVLRTPLGPVNILFRKIRDFPELNGDAPAEATPLAAE